MALRVFFLLPFAALAGCSQTEFLVDSGLQLPPPAPTLGPSSTIPIEWLDTRSREFRSGGIVVATGSETTFRSEDPRAYDVQSIFLTPSQTYYPRLSSGQAIEFASTPFGTPRHITVYPNWPYDAEPTTRADATSCAPEFAGYRLIDSDNRNSPAVGIWQSLSSANRRVVAYAIDYGCARSEHVDRRYTTVLEDAVAWQLVRNYGQGTGTRIILWSSAEVGAPLHRLLLELTNADWRGE